LDKEAVMAGFAITASGPTMFFMSGELDVATVALMDVAIGDAVARGGVITLDMADVTFADSSGIGGILKSVKALPAGCIVMHGVRERVGKVIDIMGVGRGGVSNLHVIPCLHGGQPASRD
jgi:anti-anti-sigma factor